MRLPLPTAGATVAASLLAAAIVFFAPLMDGFARVMLNDTDRRALVLKTDGATQPCVAHPGGSLCWPLSLYPVLVPEWWLARFRFP